MTVARITQQYIEAACETVTRNARVTQQYIEAACLVAPAPEGWSHIVMGIEAPTKVCGLSTFTKINGVG